MKKESFDNAPGEIKRLSDFLNVFYKESDRGAILMAASILDEVLAEIILNFLTDTKESKKIVQDFNAPISSFNSRILVAYSLGLIEQQEYYEVEAIKKIRNIFGHHWENVDFNHPKVKAQLAKLPFKNEKPRIRLNHTVANLLGDLLWRANTVIKEKRVIKTWSNKGGFLRNR